MTLWQAPIQLTSEQEADCIAFLPLDKLDVYVHEYVEGLQHQREKLEKQIQAPVGLSSDAIIQLLKQLRELDKLLQTFETRIKEQQRDFPTSAIEEKRTPMDMVRSQFKGMKLGDIAEGVLKENSRLLTTNELTRLIYDTKTDDEFDRARNSLSSELRSGVRLQNPRWKKVGRNAYITTSGGTE